ncbi:YbhB/YbcL family Raf kinase inhibitor-like protein [Natronomonas gomsonensis]|uniref:YbhB/YbcL family Raf kinase inhibitor-like protein n=1 Tax=Natronomonas gomsonensis TaxID=1046043 RepID=UPI0015C0438D|nr:YbhB/YbcL family Raf kinase inhibitor-like protein [Natronomonas gomsonensis]
MTELQLTSPVFADGDAIPRQYGYTETNVNPPLEITGVPDDAEALALVVDDPDAVEPAGKVWDHWVVYDIDPATTTIPEDWDGANALDGTNDYGETGYGGPNPPDREHTYRFRLYALDAPVDLDAGASKAELETAMDGHILESATLEGTYAP